MTKAMKEECENCHDFYYPSELHWVEDPAGRDWVECSACEEANAAERKRHREEDDDHAHPGCRFCISDGIGEAAPL